VLPDPLDPRDDAVAVGDQSRLPTPDPTQE
jgi:hypothetical protein